MITYNSACELARQFPAEIGAFLDLEAGLHGGHFGEETVTDLFLAALLKLPGKRTIVQKPDEPKTGGDMDWFIYDQNSICGYRIQSKRLSCETKKWETYSFKELAHPQNKGTQAKNLIKASNLSSKSGSLALPIKMHPLYCFYSPNIAVNKSAKAFKAIMLADAFLIERVINGIVKKKMNTPNDRRISHLHQFFFDIDLVFCPGSLALGQTPAGTISGLATPNTSVVNLGSEIRRDFPDIQRPKSAPLPEVSRRTEEINRIIADAEAKAERGEQLQEIKRLRRPRAFLRSGK